MRRLRPIAIATAAALATICSSAAAKEIAAVSICGADGCRAVADKRLLPLLAEGGLPHRAAVARSEHFVARMRVDHEGAEAFRFETVVLPEAGLMGGDEGWMELSYATQHAYAKLTRGREPLPASAMKEITAPTPAPVASPASAPAAAPGEDSSGFSWMWLAAPALVVLAGALAVVRRRGASAPAARRGRRRPAST